MRSSRTTELPQAGRPEHAVIDGGSAFVNMRVSPYECLSCLDPCGSNDFYYGEPDCAGRHGGSRLGLRTQSGRLADRTRTLAGAE